MTNPPRPLCDCNKPAYENTVTADTQDFGRRFWRCENFYTTGNHCRFFQWIDGPSANAAEESPTTPPRQLAGTPTVPPGAPRKANRFMSFRDLPGPPGSPSPTDRVASRNLFDRFRAAAQDNDRNNELSEDEDDQLLQEIGRQADDLSSQLQSQSQHSSQGQEEGSDRMRGVELAARQPLARRSIKREASPELFDGPRMLNYGRPDLEGRNNARRTSINHNVVPGASSSSHRGAAGNISTATTPDSKRPRLDPTFETPPPTIDRPIATPSRITPSSSQQSLELPPDVPAGMSSGSIATYVFHLESEVRRKTRQIGALQKSKEHLQNELKTLREEADRKAKFCEGCRKNL